jgi:hypothetical protein
MLTSLTLQNFRQFQELTIEPLARVNLITGENNTGKTSVLEGLYLLFCGPALHIFYRYFRSGHIQPYSNRNPPPTETTGDNLESFWSWLFYKKDTHAPIQITSSYNSPGGTLRYLALVSETQGHVQGNGEGSRVPERQYQINYIVNEQRVGKINVTSRSFGGTRPEWIGVAAFSTYPSRPTEDAQIFDPINRKAGGVKRLVNLLKIIEPRLVDLKLSNAGDEHIVFAEIEGMDDLIPATQLGQAFARLLRIFCLVLYAKAKIVLIDEIEDGLHYGVLEKIWGGIAAIAKQEDLQIFATTHSLECIHAAHRVFSQSEPYDFALHRLDRAKDGGVSVVTYDRESLETSFNLNWEVR